MEAKNYFEDIFLLLHMNYLSCQHNDFDSSDSSLAIRRNKNLTKYPV